MAVIVCVISYKDNPVTQEVETVQEIHVMDLDKNDKLLWVTKDPDLALQLEKDFPFLYLKEGDLAPLAHVNQTPNTDGVPKFEIYYHGLQAKFKCGEDTPQGFQPKVVGIPSPGGHS